MEQEMIYLRSERKAEIHSAPVRVKDLAKVTCSDFQMKESVKQLVVVEDFTKDEKRTIITVLKVIEKITEAFPNVQVESLGQTETLVIFDTEEDRGKGKEMILIVFVCAICFFGTAFTIMAFHNDIGIKDIFASVYEIVTGETSDGFTVLEISYSIGLAAGIILFFNHIGSRRLTKDPTPVEVEMRLYENDVDTTLVESCGREGKTIDVE